ncbi:Acyl-protein thioesterase 1 [Auxenochlorella protothecoides]|uniref:Acyl-protein thioesterase 1 n=1 Tax=Auxenochlorella protothecoides TaxID=3075 RepID=A0A087SSM5_AUXPR|nr:Acyl-protein thioesterase 1 [Auxenochlorella protothecoides]KFM28729.1 Acyl-protein thioesterase 1 [Auxenochlorella protothecoides]
MAARVFGPLITQPAAGRHSATLIMLHGLGDTGWFDLKSLDSDDLQAAMGGKALDPEGIAESIKYVDDLIAAEVAAGTPTDRIVLGGFSQGGHIALKAFLRHEPALAGCAALSTWLEPSKMPVGREYSKEALRRPIFLAHGSADPLLPPILAQTSYKTLNDAGASSVDFRIYPGMQHSSCPEEMSDFAAFLKRVVPDAPPSLSDLQGFSVKQLKQLLSSQGISTKGMFEKQELLEAASRLAK